MQTADKAAPITSKSVFLIAKFIEEAAKSSIPQTSGTPQNPRRPWWNEECRNACKEQNKAWGNLRRYPTLHNLIAFKHAKAVGMRIRREAKTNSWRAFFKGHKTTLPLVSTTGNTLEDQANTLAKHFELISSSLHYTDGFMKYKTSAERKSIRDIKKSSQDSYNCPFSIHELKVALATSSVTSQ
ncbi:uncharacterized protein LOC144174578 [Haemaphysalis longicornis]